MNEKRILQILFTASLGYIAIFSFFNIVKYQNFNYNSLDLAIIHQVFYNSSSGNFFTSSIHPPTYLKDHFSPILFLLLPFYLLWKHPLALLILQNIALASCVFPLFQIAKKYFSKKISLTLSLGWLFVPMVQNLSLFEFSFLPFSLPFLFWAWHYKNQNKIAPAMIFSALALLAREDVALVVIMFALFSIIEKKPWKWGAGFAFLAIASFIFSTKLISVNNAGGYKFFIYYSYLGDNILEIVKYVITHPLFLLTRFLSIGNIEMILGMLLPFSFLPFVKPKYLLLSLLIYLQIFLGSGGASGLILKTQYAVLFLPALILSFFESLAHLCDHALHPVLEKYLKQEKLGIIILVLAVLYSSVLLGPVLGVFQKDIFGRDVSYNKKRVQLLNSIPSDARVAASYDTLTHLSGRKNIYGVNYGFIGKEQFGQKQYDLPEIDSLVLNLSDFAAYELQYRDNPLYSDSYFSGDNRIRDSIQKNKLSAENIFDEYILFSKNGAGSKKPYAVLSDIPKVQVALNKKLQNSSELLGYNIFPQDSETVLELFWKTERPLEKNFFLKILFLGKDNKIFKEKILPLASGLYPPHEWKKGEIIQSNFWLYLSPNDKKNIQRIALGALEILEGGIFIDSDRSTKNFIRKFTEENLAEFSLAQ